MWHSTVYELTRLYLPWDGFEDGCYVLCISLWWMFVFHSKQGWNLSGVGGGAVMAEGHAAEAETSNATWLDMQSSLALISKNSLQSKVVFSAADHTANTPSYYILKPLQRNARCLLCVTKKWEHHELVVTKALCLTTGSFLNHESDVLITFESTPFNAGPIKLLSEVLCFFYY